MRSTLARSALVCATVLATTVAAAQAQDPGRWRLTGRSPIPLSYFQGLTSDDRGRLYFDGIAFGLYRTDARLRRQASNDLVIPPGVTVAEGYNHVGDPAWDAAEGGRVLLPLECYSPGAAPDGNTCRTGSIGVASPRTLRWRYYVKLDPAEIPKAMWAEVSPDGALVWTSVGQDLLAYRAAEITPGRAAPGSAPLQAARRLTGVLPVGSVTGAAFYGERLFVAVQTPDALRMWSVDLVSGTRQLEIERAIAGESEGLDVVPARGGLLHWIVTPFDPQGRLPTYFTNVLLHFAPTAQTARPVLRLRARPRRLRAGRRTAVTFTATARQGTLAGAAAGAVVRVAGRRARTDAAGRARLTIRPRRAGVLRARVTRDDAASGAVRLRVRPL